MAHSPSFKDPKTALTRQELVKFTGMQTPLPGKTPFGTLYTNVNRDYIHTRHMLILYEICAYGLLGLQLLLSAIFVILGSLKLSDSSDAILALGALSTLVTGTLAFMKGQGQPSRLRQKTLGLGKILRKLEMLHQTVEWKPVTVDDIDRLEKNYQDVLDESDQNHPDFWAVTRSSTPEKKASAPAPVPASASASV